MISKIIHYCWFRSSPLPYEFLTYIDGWKKIFSEFEIKCWDEITFDIFALLPFVQEVYQVKKYAFVVDYVCIWTMYQYGGIYMDTGIQVLKCSDGFLNCRFFTAMEYHGDNVRTNHVEDQLTSQGYKKNKEDVITDICIESSIFAAEKNHPFIKDYLDYYIGKHSILSDGTYYDKIVVLVIMALEAERYDFRYVNELQTLKEDTHLFLDEYFIHPSKQTENTYALHMVKNSRKKMNFKQRIYAKLAQIRVIKAIYNKLEQIPLVQRKFDKIQRDTWLK